MQSTNCPWDRGCALPSLMPCTSASHLRTLSFTEFTAPLGMSLSSSTTGGWPLLSHRAGVDVRLALNAPVGPVAVFQVDKNSMLLAQGPEQSGVPYGLRDLRRCAHVRLLVFAQLLEDRQLQDLRRAVAGCILEDAVQLVRKFSSCQILSFLSPRRIFLRVREDDVEDSLRLAFQVFTRRLRVLLRLNQRVDGFGARKASSNQASCLGTQESI